MATIAFKKPFAVIFEGRLQTRTVFVTKVGVLRRNLKPYAVFNKEGERFNVEFLDEESKEIVNKVVERNKKYL